MIVRDRPGLLHLFLILRGSIVQQIYPQVLIVFVMSVAIVALHRTYPSEIGSMNGAPFALVGIALSVFLGFRNNACYDRWWEARKQWGQLLVTLRDFARQTQMLDSRGGGEGVRRELVVETIAFTHLLVAHLRTGHSQNKALLLLSDDMRPAIDQSRNGPDLILRHIGARIARLMNDGVITDIQYGVLERTVAQMSAVLGACERIRNTPVPFGYWLLLHRTAYLFCFMMPFGFADTLGWATPFAAALVAYTFFGLDALGDQLEEPFGTAPNDLPIAALADFIDASLREALGETDLPKPAEPVNYLLL